MACRSKTLLAFNGRQNGRVNGGRGDGIDGNKVATTVQKKYGQTKCIERIKIGTCANICIDMDNVYSSLLPVVVESRQLKFSIVGQRCGK